MAEIQPTNRYNEQHHRGFLSKNGCHLVDENGIRPLSDIRVGELSPIRVEPRKLTSSRPLHMQGMGAFLCLKLMLTPSSPWIIMTVRT